MRTGSTAQARHRAHHISTACALGALSAGLSACSPSVPLPAQAPVDVADYVAVSSSPRPPPVEFLPPRPKVDDVVWVDGSWEWVGERFGWRAGTWAVPPKGLRRARWIITRRDADGQLFFAPSSWKDASGKKVDDTPWIHALGPEARARGRIGGPVLVEAAPSGARRPPPPREREAEEEPAPEE